MKFHAAGDQALAAALTPPGQSRSSSFGLHSCPEAELSFPRPFRRLIGSFHRIKS
jgi:hypothetical protein